jgi:hypothetical protein
MLTCSTYIYVVTNFPSESGGEEDEQLCARIILPGSDRHRPIALGRGDGEVVGGSTDLTIAGILFEG